MSSESLHVVCTRVCSTCMHACMAIMCTLELSVLSFALYVPFWWSIQFNEVFCARMYEG